MIGVNAASYLNPEQTLQKMISHFNHSSLKLEYLEIVDPETLLPLDSNWTPGATACIVAYCGDVRLIDNLTLIPIKEATSSTL
jgi:pantothenate synthetase